MNNILEKYSLDQNKVNSIYATLVSILKLSKEKVKDMITNNNDGNLIRTLAKYNLNNEQIKDVIILRSYEIDVRQDTQYRDTKHQEDKDVNREREFQQLSQAVTRNYFVPLGNYQSDPNGLLSSSNGAAICSFSCKGVVTGKFLDFVNTDSLLSYSYTPGQGFSYTISSVDKEGIVSYFSNIVNIQALQGIESSNIKVNAIDVNYDGLDDVVVSVTDSGFNDLPVILLNDKATPFAKGQQLSDCSSSNGAVQIRTGYFFGTNQPGGLWCQYNNNIGLFYKINVLSIPNLELSTAISNWCGNSQIVVLDYNGDKYDDAFCISNVGQQLFISTNGLEMQSATADGSGNVALFSVSDISTMEFVTGDFDGNGKDDLLRQDSNGNYYLYLSNGKTFFDYKKGNNNNAIEIGNGNFCGSSSTLLSGKFNVDQRSDLWCSNSNNDRFMLSTLESDRTLPKVRALLTYKNFDLNIPADLSVYNVSMATSKNFVNALDQGAVNYNVQLELNIETTNYLDSFRKDVNLINPAISGKVTYYPQYDQYDRLLSGTTIQGYVLEHNKNQQLDFDLMSPPERISANILSPWNRVHLQDSVNFSVYPNKCATAQMQAFTYKDVSAFYSVQGVLTLFDEKDVPLSGKRLLETAQAIINKPVSLTKDGQAVFNSTGNMLFSLPYAVESAVLPCQTLSSLQTTTGLPKVNVKLTYDSFVFTTPNLSNIGSQSITSKEQLQNNKQYGQASFSKTLTLEVNLAQKIDGFTLDIKNNDLVKGGEVYYMKGFNDVQLTIGQDLSGYRVEMNNKDYLKHSWTTPASQISAELFSNWNEFKIVSDAEVTLVPAQCSVAKISATLYQSVPFAYTATGHFTATDEEGYPVVGATLLAIAQNVLSKDATLDSLGEAVFSTSGTLTRNLVGSVVTEIDDCAN